MTTRPRLFTRNLEDHMTQSVEISQVHCIEWLETLSNTNDLGDAFWGLSDCKHIRVSTEEECWSSLTKYEATDTLLMVVASTQFMDRIEQHLALVQHGLLYIYLLEETVTKYELPRRQEFRGSFATMGLLITKVMDDIKKDTSLLKAQGGVKFITEGEAPEFYWNLFFFKVLQNLSHTQASKDEMISRMRSSCRNKPSALERIDEFESDYHADKAIWWYTRDAPIYRSINRCLRRQHINEVFSYRQFLSDLQDSLKSIPVETSCTTLTLYRGQSMRKTEVDRIINHIGKLMVSVSFLSTTRNQEIAYIFASCFQSETLCSVLLSIVLDLSREDIIARDIAQSSDFGDEEEYLFTPRSIFRIDDVEKIENIYHVHLTAVDDKDAEYAKIIDPWKVAINEQSFFRGRQQPLFNRLLNEENSSFLAFQILVDMMLRLERTSFARAEMIEMCRAKYAGSPEDLKMIDKFEQTYQETDAIKWYTTDSFLYRLIHEALRTENIDCIFKLRYYIQDLHNQLAYEQRRYLASLPSSTDALNLYRGQRMTCEALEKWGQNVGETVSMNSFLSTTNDCEAAVFFAGDCSLNDPDQEVSVLYQITVDLRTSHSIPFAPIQYASIFKDEDEVLFSMAAVFKITAVEPYGSLWVVDLTLINKEDEHWNQLTAHLN